jgi:hypothetical protein
LRSCPCSPPVRAPRPSRSRAWSSTPRQPTLLHRSPGIRCRGDRLSRAPRRQLSGHRHVVHRQHADESGQHTYRVRGIKADGTLSGAASVYVVYDVLPPADIAAAPTGDRLTSGKPTITWTAVRDAGRSGVKQYNIRRDGRLPRLGAQRDRHLHRPRRRRGSALLHRPRRGCSRQQAVDFSPEALVTVDRTAPDAPRGLRAAVTGFRRRGTCATPTATSSSQPAGATT